MLKGQLRKLWITSKVESRLHPSHLKGEKRPAGAIGNAAQILEALKHIGVEFIAENGTGVTARKSKN